MTPETTGRLCSDRVCIVTGAGRGIGRAHALNLAREGAIVIVNDRGGLVDGREPDDHPAAEVADEITSAGGIAVADTSDISNWREAEALVQRAVSMFGRLDVVVNNAGILRDRLLVNMAEDEWDTVLAVHAKGTFVMSHFAAVHWRDRSKADGPTGGRIINTTSASGLYGNPGQANYGAAKMAIASLTLISAAELDRYGVTVNAIAPAAITRMTEGLGFEPRPSLAPEWVSPVVTWLASTESSAVTGRVFEVSGDYLAVAEGWSRGPTAQPVEQASEVGAVIMELLASARPNANIRGKVPSA
jgi:NAD(P)-dependent dehydrogenase (short-subunit alcohol dehydrogenase family)